MLRPGDLLYVGTSPRPDTSPWATQHTGTEIRRALVMIKGRDERGRVLVRLVQDFGGPNDGNGPIGGGRSNDGNASIGGGGPNDGNASVGGRGPSDGDGPMVGRVPANGGDAPMVGDALLGAPAAPPVKRGRGRPRKHS